MTTETPTLARLRLAHGYGFSVVITRANGKYAPSTYPASTVSRLWMEPGRGMMLDTASGKRMPVSCVTNVEIVGQPDAERLDEWMGYVPDLITGEGGLDGEA